MFLDKRYKQWQEKALWQLKKYKERYTGEIAVEYTFEVKGNSVMDLDNAIVGINDILQDAGIIENDRHIIHITANKFYGFEEFRTLIDIWSGDND